MSVEHLRSLGREGGAKGMRGGEKEGERLCFVAWCLIAAVFLLQPHVTVPSQLELPTHARVHTQISQCEVRRRVWRLELDGLTGCCGYAVYCVDIHYLFGFYSLDVALWVKYLCGYCGLGKQ